MAVREVEIGGVSVLVCRCDVGECGHLWLSMGPEQPARCAGQGKHRRWNNGGDVQQVPALLAATQSDAAEVLPEVRVTRVERQAKRRAGGVHVSDVPSTAAPIQPRVPVQVVPGMAGKDSSARCPRGGQCPKRHGIGYCPDCDD